MISLGRTSFVWLGLIAGLGVMGLGGACKQSVECTVSSECGSGRRCVDGRCEQVTIVNEIADGGDAEPRPVPRKDAERSDSRAGPDSETVDEDAGAIPSYVRSEIVIMDLAFSPLDTNGYVFARFVRYFGEPDEQHFSGASADCILATRNAAYQGISGPGIDVRGFLQHADIRATYGGSGRFSAGVVGPLFSSSGSPSSLSIEIQRGSQRGELDAASLSVAQPIPIQMQSPLPGSTVDPRTTSFSWTPRASGLFEVGAALIGFGETVVLSCTTSDSGSFRFPTDAVDAFYAATTNTWRVEIGYDARSAETVRLIGGEAIEVKVRASAGAVYWTN